MKSLIFVYTQETITSTFAERKVFESKTTIGTKRTTGTKEFRGFPTALVKKTSRALMTRIFTNWHKQKIPLSNDHHLKEESLAHNKNVGKVGMFRFGMK